MINLADLIQYVYPGAKPGIDFIVQDDGTGAYIAQWNLAVPKPNEGELRAREPEFQAQYDNKLAVLERKYPTWQEQLDMLFHLGYDGWKTEIQKIKNANPKVT